MIRRLLVKRRGFDGMRVWTLGLVLSHRPFIHPPQKRGTLRPTGARDLFAYGLSSVSRNNNR